MLQLPEMLQSCFCSLSYLQLNWSFSSILVFLLLQVNSILRNANLRSHLSHGYDDGAVHDSLTMTPQTPADLPDIRMMAMDIINTITPSCKQPLMVLSHHESADGSAEGWFLSFGHNLDGFRKRRS